MKSIMIWYYYLNYRIYRYYDRKMDSMPSIYSFIGTALLLTFNIFSIVGIIGFITPVNVINKYSTIGLSLLMALLNYIILYRGNYHMEVFSNFEKNEEKYAGWKNTVPIYIIGSVILTLIVLAIADYRYDGHF